MSCMVSGNPAAPILLVVDAPGREELVLDRPLAGGAGWLLWSLAKAHGLTRADCYIVSVIGEWPERKNHEPTVGQIAKYRLAFEDAIKRSTCKIAVPLGGTALRALTGLEDGGIEAWRGYLVSPAECHPVVVPIKRETEYKTGQRCKECKGKGCGACGDTGWKRRKGDIRIVSDRMARPVLLPPTTQYVIPTLLPSGVLRAQRKTLPALNADLGRIKRALSASLIPPMKFEMELREGCCMLDPGPVLIDVETVPYLRVGAAGTVAGKPVCWTAPLDDLVRKTVRDIFAQPGVIFCAHNAQFDLKVLAEHGMAYPDDGLIYDTMMAAQHLQPDLYKGLNEVASLYMDIPRWKHKAEADPVEYNLTDVKREYELVGITTENLLDDGMMPLFTQATMPGLRVLTRMTRRGITLQPERRIKWLNDLQLEDVELRNTWHDMVGNVSPTSPQQVAQLLYGKYKLPFKYNKTGGETAERAALYELLYDLPDGNSEPALVIKALLQFRINNKLLTTYANRAVDENNLVHPYYLPVTKDSDKDDTGKGMAGTGRIQARDPNIQQLPPLARGIVVPRLETSVLVSYDFRQLELRIAAALANDTELLSALQAEDPFQKIMDDLGCERTQAKNCAYGTIYGGGPKALVRALRAKNIRISMADAKELQNAFAGSYKRLWQWRMRVMDSVGRNYFLTTPYGRRRYFYQGKGDAPAAVDFMCQGTAADISWYSLDPLDVASTNNNAMLLAQIHDEFLQEADKNNLDATITATCAVLEREWPEIAPGFVVPVGVKVGENWKDMEKYVRT